MLHDAMLTVNNGCPNSISYLCAFHHPYSGLAVAAISISRPDKGGMFGRCCCRQCGAPALVAFAGKRQFMDMYNMGRKGKGKMTRVQTGVQHELPKVRSRCPAQAPCDMNMITVDFQRSV